MDTQTSNGDEIPLAVNGLDTPLEHNPLKLKHPGRHPAKAGSTKWLKILLDSRLCGKDGANMAIRFDRIPLYWMNRVC